MKRRKIMRLPVAEGLDTNVEKSKARKEARLENLQMNVVELNYGAKAQFLREACELWGLTGDNIHSEPEKMLTVSIATSGAVSFRVSIPAGESQRLITFLQELQPWNKPAVDIDVGA